MNTLIGALLIAHAVAHVPGFLVGTHLVSREVLPDRFTMPGGSIYGGESLMRVVGVLWLVTAAVFVLAAIGAFLGSRWWPALTVCAAGLSMTISALWGPEARIGMLVNAVILVIMLAQMAIPE